PTWEQLSQPSPGFRQAPVWWRSKRSLLLEIAANRKAAYVYDRETIAEAVRTLRGLATIDRVLYAMKANPHPEVLKVVDDQGADFECVSPGEIQRVLTVFPDIDRRRILFTPNFAPRDEYAWSFEQGVHVTLDNLHPLR